MLKPSDPKPRLKPLSLYPLTPKQTIRIALTTPPVKHSDECCFVKCIVPLSERLARIMHEG